MYSCTNAKSSTVASASGVFEPRRVVTGVEREVDQIAVQGRHLVLAELSDSRSGDHLRGLLGAVPGQGGALRCLGCSRGRGNALVLLLPAGGEHEHRHSHRNYGSTGEVQTHVNLLTWGLQRPLLKAGGCHGC